MESAVENLTRMDLWCARWVVTFVFTLLLRTGFPKYSDGGVRKRFEEKFHSTCEKYPFYRRHIDTIENPRDEYVIFVYQEPGSGFNGGFGDRLAGMITAFGYAMRTNRTFLITGDKALEESFRPYHPTLRHTWGNWDWSGWNRGPHWMNMSYKGDCINPRPRAFDCALDASRMPFKVVKVKSNRSYLCRWLVRPNAVSSHELMSTLGVNNSTDLFEVAGCMLRMALWPTDALWSAVDTLFADVFAQAGFSTETSAQIGFHFRCGDMSFRNTSHVNPECVYDPAVPWKGTKFWDDHSYDSPLDEAKCGRFSLDSMLKSSKVNSSQILAYIASDYIGSGEQIKHSLGWNFTIEPPQGCHMDLQKTEKCAVVTFAHWLALSASDIIVMQSTHVSLDAKYHDRVVDKSLPHQLPPISGFSRLAAIYSLSPDVLRYGQHCSPVNKTLLSRQTHGNWVCNPKTFL